MNRKLLIASLVIFSIYVGVVYATIFSSTIDTATPLGTDAPSVIDNRIREAKAGWQERLNVDHFFDLTGTQVSDADTGEHRKVLFHAPISSPGTVAENHGQLFIKDVNSKAELHWIDEDEQEIQLTSAGSFNTALANDTYFTAVDNAGTGTVDLIKADTNDVAVVPDNSQTATNAAPTSDTGIVNKKYVDDNVGSANYTPTSYAGGESVTFPNGLIMKMGFKAVNDNTGDVTTTFSAAFPNAAVSVTIVSQHTDTQNNDGDIYLKSLSESSFVTRSYNGWDGFYWTAIGY